MSEPLTGKKLNAFKELTKLYEAKNYKKGLKNADKLLLEVKDHADTMAMRALFLFYLGEEDKALAEAKTSILKSKMQSQMCWHTYGMLLHQKRDYHEATKCYQNALRLEPGNAQIQRDTAFMQAQLRDHVGHALSRFEILKTRPNLLSNWLSYATANHLKGDFDQVVRSLSSIDTLLINATLRPVEMSGYLVYRCLIFQDANQNEEFYNELKKHEAKILDKVVFRELLVRACQRLNKQEEAIQTIENLLKDFPDNQDYIEEYSRLLNIDVKDHAKLAEFYKTIAEKFKSKAAQLHFLREIQDEETFKAEFLKFVIPYYKKNIVSLFREVKPLYDNPKTASWVGSVFSQLEASLKDGKYPDNSELFSPSEYLWSMFLKSQHLSTEFEHLPQALELINKCIAHTSTLPELYITKANIYYKLHNMKEAVQAINEARKLDLADRYLNNLCVKYMFYAGKIELAEEIMRIFMRDESSTYELQNMWYEIAEGRAHLQARRFGPGLRHLKMIHKQFLDMYEDQYDFHSYSIRKWNLREYLEMIRYMDDIHNDRKYIEAAGLMLHYLKEWAAEPPKVVEQTTKKKKKKEKEEEEDTDPKSVYRKKIDYYGEAYLKNLTDPVQEALLFAKNVINVKYVNKNNSKLNQMYFKAFGECIDLYIKQKKPLLVIKGLKKLAKTNHSAEEEHLYKLKAVIYLAGALKTEKFHQMTKVIIEKELSTLLQGTADAAALNEKVVSGWAKSYRNTLRALEAKVILSGGSRKQLIELYSEEVLKAPTLNDTFKIVHKLESYGALTEVLRTKLGEKYGAQTTYFGDWSKAIDELQKTEWSDWWLSESDRIREDEERIKHEQELAEEKKQPNKPKPKTEQKPKQEKKTEQKPEESKASANK